MQFYAEISHKNAWTRDLNYINAPQVIKETDTSAQNAKHMRAHTYAA